MSDTASTGAPAATTPAATETATTDTTNTEIKADGTTGDFDLTEETPEIEAAAAEEAKKKELANKKKYQLKVNGKAKDIELDLGNDDEIQKYLQKALAAEQKFEEAASLRKNVEALVNELRTNPLAILKHPELGIDVKALAQHVLNEELEEMSKTPEQKRIEDMEKKLAEYETQKKKLEEEKLSEQKQRLDAMAHQQLDDQIGDALAKTSLPKSTYTIKRIADVMIEAVNAGYVDVTVDEIMPIVESRIQAELHEMFETSPDEVFEKLVNKKRLDNYRKAKVQKAKAKPVVTAKQIADTGVTSKTEAKQAPKELRVKDLFKLT